MKVITAGTDASPPILCTFRVLFTAAAQSGVWFLQSSVSRYFTIFVEKRIDHHWLGWMADWSCGGVARRHVKATSRVLCISRKSIRDHSCVGLGTCIWELICFARATSGLANGKEDR